MCASFMIRTRNPGQFGIQAESRIDIAEYYDRLILPYTKAPVLIHHENLPILTAMKFSLVPSWSKEPKVKFATHNARLETIDEKPTWKTVFVRKHCLVPMTDFIEPIYEGEYAGNMVSFFAKEGTIIFAAGVWDEWVNKETGEVVQSFAIITADPPPFVAAVGHERSPVFLEAKPGLQWLENEGGAPQRLKEFLVANKARPNLDVQKHRPMRPGWEKRK